MVVDAPPGVIIEGFAAVGPPGIGPGHLTCEFARHVFIANFAKEFIEVCAFFGQETGAFLVAFQFLMSSSVCPTLRSPTMST